MKSPFLKASAISSETSEKTRGSPLPMLPKSLIAAAKAAPGFAADAMSYTITVEDDHEPVVLHQSDTTMSPAFAALLSGLQKHFSPQ